MQQQHNRKKGLNVHYIIAFLRHSYGLPFRANLRLASNMITHKLPDNRSNGAMALGTDATCTLSRLAVVDGSKQWAPCDVI